MLMKRKLNSKNFVSLMFLLCLVSISTVYAQEKRAPGNNLLIPEDKEMVEMQKRNAQLNAVQRQALDQSINELVKSLNGTWELVDRMVSNKDTGGNAVIVPTKGKMTFNLQATGTRAAGSFVVREEGVGSYVISQDVGNGEAFALGSYNEVNFEAGFESTTTSISGGNKASAEEQRAIIIREQIVGEIQGSYGIFREPVVFSQTSRDLTQYVAMKSATPETAEMYFVARSAFRALNGENRESVDAFDIIKLNGDVMVLGISSKGIIDVWKKTSSSVQMEGRSLKAYWESIKSSQRLTNPTFGKSK